MMLGPEIIARSIESHSYIDKFGNRWQYNPWSDHHSKVACWAVLFDLLITCELLRRHTAAGTAFFGINHEMSDFRMDRKKDLDLVICTRGTGEEGPGPATFAEMAEEFGIVLSRVEREILRALPALSRAPVGVVHLALEAKATMTEHVKSLPRLHDELTSSHVCIHGNSNRVIAVGLSIINAGAEFISPKNNLRALKRRQPRVNVHSQPKAATRTVDKVRQVARRSNVDERGFDAIGVLMLDTRNDGSRVRVVSEPPAVPASDIFHYDAMIRRAAQLYEARFPHA